MKKVNSYDKINNVIGKLSKIVWSDIMNTIYTFLLENIYLFICIIIVLIIMATILFIIASNQKNRKKIKDDFVEAEREDNELNKI